MQTIIWIIHFLKPHITVQNSKLFKHRKQIQIQWLGFQVLETFAWFAEWLESWSHEAEINVRDNQPQNHFCISCIYVLIITLMLVCVARKKKKSVTGNNRDKRSWKLGGKWLINLAMAGLGIWFSWFSNFFVWNKSYSSSKNNKMIKYFCLQETNNLDQH